MPAKRRLGLGSRGGELSALQQDFAEADMKVAVARIDSKRAPVHRLGAAGRAACGVRRSKISHQLDVGGIARQTSLEQRDIVREGGVLGRPFAVDGIGFVAWREGDATERAEIRGEQRGWPQHRGRASCLRHN